MNLTAKYFLPDLKKQDTLLWHPWCGIKFIGIYVPIHVWNIQPSANDKCPVFFGFCSKLTRTKTQQSTDKASENNWRTVFKRVSSGGVNFVFYPLSYLHFTSSLFAPTYLLASSPTNTGVRRPPRTRQA